MRFRRFIKTILWFVFDARRWKYLTRREFRLATGGMHRTTELQGDGSLDCAEAVVFGRRTRLSIPGGARLVLGKNAWLGDDCEIAAGAIKIGAHSSLQHRSIVLGDVIIGAGCACGANLYISSAWHHFEDIPALPIRWQDARASAMPEGEERSRPVVVGDDCWIGINVVIVPGVKIGRGCVIGANSVVTRDLPPYSVAAGVPAKVLRKRLNFSPPGALRADSIEHLPYFYSGFAQWGEGVDHLGKALHEGGWPVAEAQFAVAIAIEQEDGIEVRVRATVAGEIRHGSQTMPVMGGVSSLHFHAVPDSDGLLVFAWQPSGMRASVPSTLTVLAVDRKQ